MEFTFEGNTTLPTLDKVPENLRIFYDKPEGAEEYTLKDDPVTKAAVATISGHQKALRAAREEAKKAKDNAVDLSPLQDFGQTPDEIAQTVQEKIKEASSGKDQDVQQQIEKIKQELATNHAQEKEKLQANAKHLQGQLFSLLGTQAAKSTLKELGVTDPDLALPFILPHLKPQQDENGEYRITVVDDDGHVRFSGATGSEMSVKELCTSMKNDEKFAPLFRSEAPSGGGTKPGAPGRTVPPTGEQLTATQKIARGLQQGQHSRA